MSEKEISLLAEETREWVRRLRARKAAETDQPYTTDGTHVTVGRERPLAEDFLSTAESAEAAEAVQP